MALMTAACVFIGCWCSYAQSRYDFIQTVNGSPEDRAYAHAYAPRCSECALHGFCVGTHACSCKLWPHVPPARHSFSFKHLVFAQSSSPPIEPTQWPTKGCGNVCVSRPPPLHVIIGGGGGDAATSPRRAAVRLARRLARVCAVAALVVGGCLASAGVGAMHPLGPWLEERGVRFVTGATGAPPHGRVPACNKLL